MKVKISAGFTGVIATGSYENSRPSYSAEIEMEVPDMLPEEFVKFTDQRQKQLQEICYGNFKQDEQRQIVERINKERSDFRFYDCPVCKEKHPSVTSVIGWDTDFFMPPHELQQYASQGNLYDLQAKHFILTGEWPPVEKIEGSWADIVILKKGNLGLELNGWNFPAFLKKHPIEGMEIGKPLVSCKYKTGGTPDIRKGIYEGKKTLIDVKRTPDKAKHFKQTAAYVLLEEENGESSYEQMMLIPANDKTAQGFSKPVITTEIGQFKAMFLKDRERFRMRFGC